MMTTQQAVKDRLVMIFYQNGLNKVGWNIYSTINLEYKNQVVCTKIPKPIVKKVQPVED